VVVVVLLAATRKSLSGPEILPADRPLGNGKYPYGYLMTIGILAGLMLGLLLGLAVRTIPGGISIGIGLGIILGKWLDRRNDRDTKVYTDEETRERLRRASWGLIVMILLVLATLGAFFLTMLD
jgi:hypothetical protein